MNACQTKFGLAQPVQQRRDPRLLTGKKRKVSDLVPQVALGAMVLRSHSPRGRIRPLHVEEARNAPGVNLVPTVADHLARSVEPAMKGRRITTEDGKGASPERPVRAASRIRFVGRARALVTPGNPEAARDAVEMSAFDIIDLAPALHLKVEGPALHSELSGTHAFDDVFGDETGTRVAMRRVARRSALDVADNGVTAARWT